MVMIHDSGGGGGGSSSSRFRPRGEEELDIASLSLGRREAVENDVLEPGTLKQRTGLCLGEPARVRDDVRVLRHDGRLRFAFVVVRLHARDISDGERAARLQVLDELARDVLDRGEMVVCHRALLCEKKTNQ